MNNNNMLEKEQIKKKIQKQGKVYVRHSKPNPFSAAVSRFPVGLLSTKSRSLRKNGNEKLNQDYFNNQQYEANVEKNSDQTKKSKKQQSRVKTENDEYRKLYDNLSSIQKRIVEMKVGLQKKKSEKQRKENLQEPAHKKQAKNSEFLRPVSIKRQTAANESKSSSDSGKLKAFITKEAGSKKQKFVKCEKLRGFVTGVPEIEGHALDKDPYSPRSSNYYISEVIKGYQDKESFVREHLKSSIEFLGIFSSVRMPSNQSIGEKSVKLNIRPGFENKITIVFDLDETLIHCNESIEKEHMVKLPIKFPTGELIDAGINIRPGVTTMLEALADKFELIIFTASHQCYANVVIDYLDPQNKLIHHRLYRQHCHLIPNGPYVKDLRIINRPLNRMVLIDNAAYSYAFQMENGIPIIPYYSGDKDYQLKALTHYLLQNILFCEDVRTINRKTFKLHYYRNYKGYDIQKMVESLYINQNSR